jgi:protein tyrosine phosphatase (PTP) superfamily phosphohydrolase (DUF442 family)
MHRELVVLSPRVAAGSPPTKAALKTLALAGYHSVVALRSEDEPSGRLPAGTQEQMAKRLGMVYETVPVSGPTPEPSEVERFRQAMAAVPPPVFVAGVDLEQAVALASIHVALRNAVPADVMLARAQREGGLETPELVRFVSTYIEYHVGA